MDLFTVPQGESFSDTVDEDAMKSISSKSVDSDDSGMERLAVFKIFTTCLECNCGINMNTIRIAYSDVFAKQF